MLHFLDQSGRGARRSATKGKNALLATLPLAFLHRIGGEFLWTKRLEHELGDSAPLTQRMHASDSRINVAGLTGTGAARTPEIAASPVRIAANTPQIAASTLQIPADVVQIHPDPPQIAATSLQIAASPLQIAASLLQIAARKVKFGVGLSGLLRLLHLTLGL